jgi:hypothetical protein
MWKSQCYNVLCLLGDSNVPVILLYVVEHIYLSIYLFLFLFSGVEQWM